MCAASPTRNKLPHRRGFAINDLSGAIDFSIDGPVIKVSADSSAPGIQPRII